MKPKIPREKMETYCGIYNSRPAACRAFPYPNGSPTSNWMGGDIIIKLQKCIYYDKKEKDYVEHVSLLKGHSAKEISDYCKKCGICCMYFDTKTKNVIGTCKFLIFAKIGRNEKCGCGSDIKFKKCCGALKRLPIEYFSSKLLTKEEENV